VGCVVYADDIVLLSVSCFGLQRLVDTCGSYGTQWDIKFNSTKSKVIYFGSATKVLCGISLNGSIIESVDKVKYLGVYFERNSGHSDISQSFVKFFSQFNNIMAVLDKHSNEMTALHLVKTYCLPSLLFGCEIWNLTAHSIYRLHVAWNNCFRFIFRGFWRESVKVLQYYCSSLPVKEKTPQRDDVIKSCDVVLYDSLI